ncbi:MAG TPA: polynucleotide adenylyltransferase [Candidatus Atribacteria bacterium]|nr:MAG: Polynucleotide adenylyltransferase region [Atribacteria bacterium 34_128]HAJ33363.1 polynucleotide adenylyltransferase [Candidatus Atribacteria bacterium]
MNKSKKEGNQLKVIISHQSTDFDSLAAMIAAKKIYKDALLVFTGAVEKNVRKFISIYGELIEITPLKKIKIEEITKLIIVDTRIKRRIGPFANVINKRDLEIHIYDHHPSTADDIKGDINVIEEVGATTTIILKKIRKMNLEISPIEATLFALGIYEDTGSLTFSTTTIDDINSISYLFDKGIKLKVVANFINIGLSIAQKKLLNKLLLSSKEIFCKGVRINMAKAEVKNYTEGLALLTHKLIEIENSDVFFTIVKMVDRIYIVGRSRTNSVDVDEILKELGGGGHFQAASAVVKDLSLDELEKKLIRILKRKIRVGIVAKDIMSSPVKTVNPSASIEETKKILLRYGHNGIPVIEEGELKGIITMQEVNRAKQHGFGKEFVSKFMSDQVVSVKLNTPLTEIQELMINYDIGRILVINQENRLAGIITRTDLIRNLYGEGHIPKRSFSTYVETSRKMERKKQIELIEKIFPKRVKNILSKIGEIGDRLNFPVFMVGGILRDFFLGIKNYDLDIVVEGEGIKFARELSRDLGGRIKSHEKFGTAIVILTDGFKIDVATARREFYEYPAAFPKVELSSIKKDLYRRDFTINAMAIQLNQKYFGKLIDFFGGQKDLRTGIIRVLYNLSFVEDPARIIRAIRFEQRYNFKMDRATEGFLKKAIDDKLLSRLRKKRITEELILILKEENPLKSLKRMEELGALKYILPDVELNEETIKRLNKVKDNYNFWKRNIPDEKIELWVIYFCCLIKNLEKSQIQKISKKLIFKQKSLYKINYCYSNLEKVKKFILQKNKISPSIIYLKLSGLPNEVLFLAMMESNDDIVKERIVNYLRKYKKESLYISGKELKELQVKPGPIYSQILNKLLCAQLNGEVKNKRDEIRFVKNVLKERNKI